MLILLLFTTVLVFDSVHSHGHLLNPASRNSLWRFVKDAPKNYDDNGLNCGGYDIQHSYNRGKCGICGDAFNTSRPRPHENGGEFGQGKLTNTYYAGDNVTTLVRITANHRGYFNFSLCNLDENPEDESCFKPLKLASGEDVYHIKYFLPLMFKPTIKLPENIMCHHCILRWTWISGNNWGTCSDGTEAVGCGPQENFVNCADIAIYPNANYGNDLAK